MLAAVSFASYAKVAGWLTPADSVQQLFLRLCFDRQSATAADISWFGLWLLHGAVWLPVFPPAGPLCRGC